MIQRECSYALAQVDDAKIVLQMENAGLVLASITDDFWKPRDLLSFSTRFSTASVAADKCILK